MHKIKGLCLEGGGAAGIAHIGALRLLNLKEIEFIVGSSAGAIAAAALACGASIDFLQETLWNTDFTKFKDDSWGLVRDMNRLVCYFGWYKGEALLKWIESVLKTLTGDGDITFQQAYKKYGIFLEITNTDINSIKSETLYLSYKTHPDMPLKTAVHRSALIPVFYQADCVDEKEKGYHYYVDGGVMDNYPLWRLYKHIPPEECVGLKLVTSKELSQIGQENHEMHLLGFLKHLITMLRAQAMKSHVKSVDWVRTIAIDVGAVSATDFDLSNETKTYLIKQGEEAAKKFLAK